MSWQQFETLVGEGFRRRGYSVKETGGGGPYGSVDLVLSKNGEKTLVQCKQWKAFKVGVSGAIFGLVELIAGRTSTGESD